MVYIVNNLNLKGVLGLHVVAGEYLIPNVAEEHEVVLPSVFIPVYAYFVYLIKYFFANIIIILM